MFEIRGLIISRQERFGKYQLPVLKIQSDHYYRNAGFFSNMIKSRPQTVHFFSGTLWRKSEYEFIPAFKKLNRIINKVVMMKPVDRHTPQPTEKETERSFEQFLFPQESESLEVKRFSESKTNDDIPAAGMRRYDHNGLL